MLVLVSEVIIYFNPRSLTGATSPNNSVSVAPMYFNPRSLTGATQISLRRNISSTDFNPRSLTGATNNTANRRMILYISIHAPSRERPRPRVFQGSPSSISIHAPSRERRFYFGRPLVGQTISIHAPSRERLMINFMMLSIMIFQSTLPHGSDYAHQNHKFQQEHFNPRSLTGATASKQNTSTFI